MYTKDEESTKKHTYKQATKNTLREKTLTVGYLQGEIDPSVERQLHGILAGAVDVGEQVP